MGHNDHCYYGSYVTPAICFKCPQLSGCSFCDSEAVNAFEEEYYATIEGWEPKDLPLMINDPIYGDAAKQKLRELPGVGVK